MSYDGHICLEKKMQTKPLSIAIDRNCGFAFSKYQTCKLALPYGIKTRINKKQHPQTVPWVFILRC
jgi:hypothetical protein